MKKREPIQVATGRSDAGFGLIGVIVAIALLSIGVLSMSGVLTQSVAMQTIIAQRTSALYVAQATMEGIRAVDPLTITAQSEIRVDEDGGPNPNGVYTREVIVGSAGRNLIAVTVIVTSPRSAPIHLVTWIYDGAF